MTEGAVGGLGRLGWLEGLARDWRLRRTISSIIIIVVVVLVILFLAGVLVLGPETEKLQFEPRSRLCPQTSELRTDSRSGPHSYPVLGLDST